MRLTSALWVGTVAATVLVVSLVPASAVGNPSVRIRILFDFADGTYVWASETIPDPQAWNATWDAVKRAASSMGIELRTTWYANWGVFVDDVGGRNPPGGVGVYEWNGTSGGWDFARIGLSTLVLGDGASIALYDAGYAYRTYAGRWPAPTPDHPSPSTMFRSDLANSGVAGSSAPHRVRVVWDRNTGRKEIGSSPTVAGGKVFVSTLGGVVALDAKTGEVLWNTSRGAGFSSPAAFNGSLYVGTSAGTVVRLDAANGSLQWETRLLSTNGFTGISSSPKVAFDWVFVGTFNETGGPGEVVALWEANGTVRWRHATGSIHFSSPAYADGTVYAGVMGTYNTTTQISFDPPYGVLALDAATGEQRWFRPTGGSVAASPAIVGRDVIVPSKDGKVYALNRTTGAIVWASPVGAGISSLAVHGDSLFVGGGTFGGEGNLTAIDAATGSVRWSSPVNGPVQSSVTYAGGVIVFATNTERGTVYGVNATTGALEWSFEPMPSQYILGSPVVADGVVFAPSDNGHVYALGDAGPALAPADSLIPLVIGGTALGAAGIAVAIVAWVVIRRRRRGGP